MREPANIGSFKGKPTRQFAADRKVHGLRIRGPQLVVKSKRDLLQRIARCADWRPMRKRAARCRLEQRSIQAGNWNVVYASEAGAPVKCLHGGGITDDCV